jgi:prevent-host-death family protein
MKTVPATEFKIHCLALLEQVNQSREPLVVTKHGRPVVQVVPYVAADEGEANPLKGSVVFEGDIVSPLDVPWEAAR